MYEFNHRLIVFIYFTIIDTLSSSSIDGEFVIEFLSGLKYSKDNIVKDNTGFSDIT